MRERNANAKLFLQEAMKEALIYVNGDRAQIGAKDVNSRINDALGRLISTVYHKLSYIDTAMNEANIRALFKSTEQQSFTLEDGREANAHAIHDVLSFIATNTNMHIKTSMKSIMDRFMKAPYGFIEEDVEYLVAKLFKDGDISFTVNGESVTLINRKQEEIIRYITKKEYVERLLTERRQQAGIEEKKAVREVMKELFGFSGINEDDDSMMQSFQSYSKSLIAELEKTEILYNNYAYPGEKAVTSGKQLLRSIAQIQFPAEFYKKIHKDRDDFLDFAEDYEPVKTFFAGEQKNIFKDALKLMDIYDESKTFIVDDKVENRVRDIKDILNREMPYSHIPKLPGLLDEFKQAYMAVLTIMEKPVLKAIKNAKERVFEVLKTKAYIDEYKDEYSKLFNEIYKKATECNNVATLQNVRLEADALKIRLLNEMTKRDELLAEEILPYGDEDKSKPTVTKSKNISIKSVSLASSWQIKTVEDLDKYINELRKQILKELEENTIINIEL